MNDKHRVISEFLKQIPDTFNILEVKIDMETQKEYLDYSHSFGHGELTENETINLGNMLFESKIGRDDKKKVLTLLAHLGTITAFRQIEKYFKNPGNVLKQWTALALQECKMFLESTLTDQSVGFISSGLGGFDDKLRFFFLVLSASDISFTTTQKKIIKDEFNLIAKELNCVVESVDLADAYAGLTALVPLDIAVGNFIEAGIKKCNEYGEFVFEYYYVTNQQIPNKSEIPDIIKIVKE